MDWLWWIGGWLLLVVLSCLFLAGAHRNDYSDEKPMQRPRPPDNDSGWW